MNNTFMANLPNVLQQSIDSLNNIMNNTSDAHVRRMLLDEINRLETLLKDAKNS